MAYLPENEMCDARKLLYNRTVELSCWIRNASETNLAENRNLIADKLQDIARAIKEECFAIQEIAFFAEEDFWEEKKLLIKHLGENGTNRF